MPIVDDGSLATMRVVLRLASTRHKWHGLVDKWLGAACSERLLLVDVAARTRAFKHALAG